MTYGLPSSPAPKSLGRLSLVAITLQLLVACALPDRRFSIVEENDLFSSGAGEDRDYSQGLVLAWEADREGTLASVGTAILKPFDFLDPLGRGEDESLERRDVRWALEQRIYTPDDLDSPGFVEDQRPFAAILTLGVRSRHVRLDPDPERRRDRIHTFGIAAGTTGDAALGELGQRGTHYLLGEADPPGWPNQIDGEPVLQLEWDLRHRVAYGAHGALEWDATVGGRSELGTAFTNLQSGFDLRLGRELPRDRRPWTANIPALALYGFAGANLRLALHDITLDGSWLGSSDPELSLEREPWVAQWTFGVAAEFHGFTVAWRFLRQTREYERELGYHDWGTIWLGYRYVF
ncbi:MAG: lipid A deacylase LpxR family protein [Planctomycetota bacterium]|jgi:hypothetical protein